MKYGFNKMLVALGLCMAPAIMSQAASHREAPIVAMDPQADNTDLYAFKNPNDSSKIIIIANYIPFEAPQAGPNYYTFSSTVRYEIHIKNTTTTSGDDITYRFTFQRENEDSTTAFNIRFGKQNQKNTYTLERKYGNAGIFTPIVTNGIVPPPNIGPRSIEAGLGVDNYDSLMMRAIRTSSSGERVFAGPIDDPYFADLGGMFDLGGFRNPGLTDPKRDGLYHFNTHSLVIEVPVTTLQRTGKDLTQAVNILDQDYVIGVWASASRQAVDTIHNDGRPSTQTGPWIQVGRVGMPLTNDIVVPQGQRDFWNSVQPGSLAENNFLPLFRNPEFGLYVDSSSNGYGAAFPGLTNYLHVQSFSIPAPGYGPYDFRNTKAGLWSLAGTAAVNGTAFDPTTYGGWYLPNANSPRAVDMMPWFMTGIPNLPPYQLAVQKGGNNPLNAGKPFANNFFPLIGDMLRLNMATPTTPRTLAGAPNPAFSSNGLLAAIVTGLTNPTFNTSANLQFIPNMDGFPNGRRLEDDVVTITMQMFGGSVLAAMGYWYDDYTPGLSPTPFTTQFLRAAAFTAGPTRNDTTFKTGFPFVQQPWRAYNGAAYVGPLGVPQTTGGSLPDAVMVAFPNPLRDVVSFKYKLAYSGKVRIDIMDINGRMVNSIDEGTVQTGEHIARWNAGALVPGNYFARFSVDGDVYQSVKLVKVQ